MNKTFRRCFTLALLALLLAGTLAEEDAMENPMQEAEANIDSGSFALKLSAFAKVILSTKLGAYLTQDGEEVVFKLSERLNDETAKKLAPMLIRDKAMRRCVFVAGCEYEPPEDADEEVSEEMMETKSAENPMNPDALRDTASEVGLQVSNKHTQTWGRRRRRHRPHVHHRHRPHVHHRHRPHIHTAKMIKAARKAARKAAKMLRMAARVLKIKGLFEKDTMFKGLKGKLDSDPKWKIAAESIHMYEANPGPYMKCKNVTLSHFCENKEAMEEVILNKESACVQCMIKDYTTGGLDELLTGIAGDDENMDALADVEFGDDGYTCSSGGGWMTM